MFNSGFYTVFLYIYIHIYNEKYVVGIVILYIQGEILTTSTRSWKSPENRQEGSIVIELPDRKRRERIEETTNSR